MARKKLIVIRKGTAAEWTTANPILALGELGLETDTHKLKGGDGVTTWSSLAYITDGGGGGGSVAWGGITGTLSAQADLQSALDAKADDSQITTLQTQIDGKQPAGSYASSTHSHAISDVTGLATELSGLAPTVHSHAMSDVTGLVTALDGKQDDLVSGTNIKTVNGTSLLGSGDLVISGGGGLQLYIQDTEPTWGIGEKALWIDTTGGNLNFWVQDGA